MFCPKCGREYNLKEGQKFCSFCGNLLDSLTPSHEIGLGDETANHGSSKFDDASRTFKDSCYSCPWENMEELGFFQGFTGTLKQSLFEPVRFFTLLPRTGGWLHPLLYGMIVGTLGNLAGYVFGSFFDLPWVSQGKLSPGLTLFVGILMPVLVWLGIMLWAVILHGSLFLFGARNERFEATLRVVSYAASPDVFNVVPGIGWIVAAVWKLVLVIIGVREIQGISTGRAALAALFPVVLIWGLFFTVIIAIMATAALATRGL